MFSKKKIDSYTKKDLAELISTADAIVIGAGAGLSASAGYSYSGARFMKHFADFNEKYGISDMYSGSFYPFEKETEFWSFHARKIYCNRYSDEEEGIKSVYPTLLNLVKDKNYFVITTNADHHFQRAGFDKSRLFYTQGDYGLFQCEIPCQHVTYDNKEMIDSILASQKGMEIEEMLIPICPNCGSKLTLNLRMDERFVQDKGWDLANKRYSKFLDENLSKKILFLDLGIGMNTPGIIKYPFIKMTYENENAFYVSINHEKDFNATNIKKLGIDITKKSLFLNSDIYEILTNAYTNNF